MNYSNKTETMKTVEELLKPRYKVIADYPKSVYEVGTIINAGTTSEDCIYCDREGPRMRHYPHLFQPLPWWSDRKVEDMPEYVRCLCYGGEDERIGGVAIVEQGNILHENAIWLLKDDKICFMWPLKYLKPIEKEEYELFKQQKQK